MGENRQRIDKWLFFARIVKSRTLAAKLAQSGRVRVNGDKIDLASRQVVPGDVLTVTLDRQVKVLRIVSSGERRGPYEEARLLLRRPEPAAKLRAAGQSQAHVAVARGRQRPSNQARTQAIGQVAVVGRLMWEQACDKLTQAVWIFRAGRRKYPNARKLLEPDFSTDARCERHCARQ